MFEGVHTALVTPFQNGSLDEDSFRNLIDAQFAGNVAGVVPVGTTGESPTLTHSEHERVIELAIEHTNGRGLVTAGTGSNATAEAIRLTKAAEKAGANASLQVCPYYNKPSQEGLFQHFRAIAEETELKIVLYSIPGRCGIEIGVDTIAKLAQTCPNIIAVKEAGGTPERVSQIHAATPDHFEILSGDDSLTLPFMSVGGIGVISVASNVIPAEMSEMVSLALKGDFPGAYRIHQQFYPLFSSFLKLDTNPAPVKTALALTGLIEEEIRLPMVCMSDEKREILRETLTDLDIL